MPRSFLVFAIALLALVAGVLFYVARTPVEQTAANPVAIYEQADTGAPVYPSFKLPDVAGTERDFSEWAGKTRLLNFWATWCAPCRREIPLLKAFQEEHGANGFQIIGIAVDFPDQVAAYAESAEFNYPILVGQEDAMAIAETSGIEFIGMPFTMIVAADGELLNAHIGEIVATDLEHVVEVITRFEQGELDKEGARKALNTL
ncbi:MAG: TlpA family protein disulfide reductase [Gammaproteobacteria bacterium]|nr:TlpA family protein disulfide reductase [Gammaproteobacteria bacterium]MDH3431881.1 TlpA family protein disulfide reductase [Gammaproteobacteria bacterium]MDH3435003.1 TlpA family protein disulfide reductase [Gammaproteobacteria bacterium]